MHHLRRTFAVSERAACRVVGQPRSTQRRTPPGQTAEPGDTVVVRRVDRLGRSLIDVLTPVKLLRDREVQVQSVTVGIDPATPTGRLMLNMLGTLAEYERDPQ